MSQADVDAVNGYTRDIMIDGYSVNGVLHPGVAKVVEESQRRIDALSAKFDALDAKVAALPSAIDVDALATALAPKLPAGTPVGDQQLRDALRDVLGSLNDQPSA